MIDASRDAVEQVKKTETKPEMFHKTKHGKILLGDSLDVLDGMKSGSVDLIMTSPPFGLVRKKEYGNADALVSGEWRCRSRHEASEHCGEGGRRTARSPSQSRGCRDAEGGNRAMTTDIDALCVRLEQLDAAKRPYSRAGATPQTMGCETYRLVATGNTFGVLMEAANALRELAECRRDAERYRWLTSRAKQNTSYDVYGNGGHWCLGFHSTDSRLSFTDAIDAAMAGETA